MAIGNTKFKAEHGLLVVGNTEIEQDLLVLGSANVAGDLTVSGSMVFSANIIGNFLPDVSGRALGSSSQRWEVWANSINVSNTATFAGNTIPSTNSVALGSDSNRWAVRGTTADFSANVNVSSVLSVVGTIDANAVVEVGPALVISSNTYSFTGTSNTIVLDSFSSSAQRTTKYLIEMVSSNGGIMATEILMTHDTSTVFMTQYGCVNTISEFCSYDADISTGNVRLLATPTVNTTFKVVRTSMK